MNKTTFCNVFYIHKWINPTRLPKKSAQIIRLNAQYLEYDNSVSKILSHAKHWKLE